MIDTIIYHADCPDGFCAAFVVKTWNVNARDAKLVPARYARPIDDEDVKGKDVVVVDFSWPREETIRLHDLSESMVILDHHKTAEAEIGDLPYCTFDMERSGAQLAWDWCAQRTSIGPTRPWFVDYVADRDLWRWQLPSSKVVNAYLMILPYEPQAWASLSSLTVEQAAILGVGARAQIEHYVRLVCNEALTGTWAGLPMRIVNAPYVSISDVGNQLCEDGAEVGVGWFVRGDGMMQFSLRSKGETDVSALAAIYGGGGHRNASGFQLSLPDGLALLASWGIA